MKAIGLAVIGLLIVIALQLASIGSHTDSSQWREPPWWPAPTEVPAKDLVRFPNN